MHMFLIKTIIDPCLGYTCISHFVQTCLGDPKPRVINCEVAVPVMLLLLLALPLVAQARDVWSGMVRDPVALVFQPC